VNLRPKRKEPPEINVVPLVDVLFILVLFLAVSTTFQRQTRIKVQLPEASAQAATAEKVKPIDVTIDAQGNIYVDQRETVNSKVDTVKRALEKVLGTHGPEPSLLITADGRSPHQAVITTMDAASQLGIFNMSFAARQPNTE
jgi:biopolymer transport protein ExbD